MLDGAGDAAGDVELGRHHLAGLADLQVVGAEAGVDRGARGADGGVELVGERLEELVEVLGRLEGAAAGDDDAGGGQFGAVDLVSSAATKVAGDGRSATAIASTGAGIAGGAAGKAEARTVITRFASAVFTVSTALPA